MDISDIKPALDLFPKIIREDIDSAFTEAKKSPVINDYANLCNSLDRVYCNFFRTRLWQIVTRSKPVYLGIKKLEKIKKSLEKLMGNLEIENDVDSIPDEIRLVLSREAEIYGEASNGFTDFPPFDYDMSEGQSETPRLYRDYQGDIVFSKIVEYLNLLKIFTDSAIDYENLKMEKDRSSNRRPQDDAALELVDGMACVWRQITGSNPGSGINSAKSDAGPFARFFIELNCQIRNRIPEQLHQVDSELSSSLYFTHDKVRSRVRQLKTD